MPELAGAVLEPDHPGFAALPSQHTAITKLSAPSRVERRLGQRHFAGPGGGNAGLHHERLGMFMTVEVHDPQLGTASAAVLAKIAGVRPRRRGRTAKG